MAVRRKLNVTIIGAGKVGSVLGRILAEEGERVVCVISRTLPSARRAAAFIGTRVFSTRLSDIPVETDLIFITTPHGAIEDVARALAQVEHFRFRRLAVCHASGILTARALQPLAERGATVFSFHPLQTFPRDFHPRAILPSARGIVYGVDGSPGAIVRARRLARSLRGRVLLVPPERRVLYHAACVVASNHLTTMLRVVQGMGERCGMKPDAFWAVFGPIVEATLRNVAGSSPAEALSGPIARGGIETLSLHLDAVREASPELIPYFVAVSRETVRLALDKGSISRARAEEMEHLLTSTMSTSSTEKGMP
jgi:predicted short-subunit dehydrogenase-like oxidoreductase (DUF2520 family)